MCESYEFAGALNFHQSDNWDVRIPATGKQLNGQVIATGPGGREIIYGNPRGGITGRDVIDFQFFWKNGHQSRYFGTIKPDGNADGGRDNENVHYDWPEPIHDSMHWFTSPPTLKCLSPPQ